MNLRSEEPTKKPRDPDFIGSDVAMRRAAKRAQQRAKETARMTAVDKESGQSRHNARRGGAQTKQDSGDAHRPRSA